MGGRSAQLHALFWRPGAQCLLHSGVDRLSTIKETMTKPLGALNETAFCETNVPLKSGVVIKFDWL